MRTLDEIFTEILEEKAKNPALDSLNSNSKVAIWRNLLWVVAFAIFIHEQIFGAHTKEVQTIIDEEKPGTPRWYRNKVKEFQYGFPMFTDDDQFDNTGFTGEEIAESKIIKYCAVTESETESLLIIKIAGEENGKLSQIPEEKMDSFKYYLEEFNYAGVKYSVINYRADKLVLNLKIFRNANILDAYGTEILTGKKPVEIALQQFMKELPFNGELVINQLIDKLQRVNGVINPHLVSASTSWINPDAGTYGNLEGIAVGHIPVSGYYEIDWELSKITYV